MRKDSAETHMTDISAAGAYTRGDRPVGCMGYGAMRLAGPGVFGPPRYHRAALDKLNTLRRRELDTVDG